MRNYRDPLFDLFPWLSADSFAVFPKINLILKIVCFSHRERFGEKLTISTDVGVVDSGIGTSPSLNLNPNVTVGTNDYMGRRNALLTEEKDGLSI